ncbi:MAG: DUF4286 family protein [Bacteroidota bacterium]
MIVYSVSATVEASVHDDWLDWMTEKHIPEVMATGFFESYTIQRLLDPAPEPGTFTYNIQYLLPSIYEYQQYQAKDAPALKKDHSDRYRDKVVAFRTLLKRL